MADKKKGKASKHCRTSKNGNAWKSAVSSYYKEKKKDGSRVTWANTQKKFSGKCAADVREAKKKL